MVRRLIKEMEALKERVKERERRKWNWKERFKPYKRS